MFRRGILLFDFRLAHPGDKARLFCGLRGGRVLILNRCIGFTTVGFDGLARCLCVRVGILHLKIDFRFLLGSVGLRGTRYCLDKHGSKAGAVRIALGFAVLRGRHIPYRIPAVCLCGRRLACDRVKHS